MQDLNTTLMGGTCMDHLDGTQPTNFSRPKKNPTHDEGRNGIIHKTMGSIPKGRSRNDRAYPIARTMYNKGIQTRGT